MTILLTGGTGFLGSNILNELIRDGFDIILLKRSTSNIFRIERNINKIISYNLDEIKLEEVFENHKIDTILHCATDYGRKQADPLQIVDANLILPLRLIELGKRYHIKCFINTDTILDKRVSHYSLSKKQFGDWFMNYKNDMRCVNVALEHFFGPNDDKTKFVSHVIGQLLGNVEKLDLTPGEQKRDFVYIDDVVSGFKVIIKEAERLENGYYEFEIGSGNLVSIKEFVIMIRDIIGNTKTKLNFGALEYRENEVMSSNVNLEKISQLGWSCENSLSDGLKKTINFEINKKKDL